MTTPVYAIAPIADLDAACAGSSKNWLTPAEREAFGALRNEDRRWQWRAARWLAKQLIRETSSSRGEQRLRLEEIEIISRDGHGRAMRPCVVLNGRSCAGSLSIAHTAGLAMAAWTTDADVRLGIDATPADLPRSMASDLWLTGDEQRWLQDEGSSSLTATLWTIKEAVYKATNRGEPFVPTSIPVEWSAGQFHAPHVGGISRECQIEVTERDVHVVALAILSTNRTKPARNPRKTEYQASREALAPGPVGQWSIRSGG